ncbi:MAG: polyphosphate kinase 1 [Acidobacteria bacterium]|nr:polyphosphate kinase 1 [Acidobacteriota bacterium]
MPSPANTAAVARRSPAPVDPADLTNPALYINRELSWLEFNQRVLMQAQGDRHPLLERIKFVSIVATNFDEFFMVRVATLLRKFRNGVEDMSPDGLTTERQLDAIRVRANRMMADLERCWSDVLRPLLAAENIRILERKDFTPAVTRHLRDFYARNVHPVLTPLAFDPGHPFPFISNLSMNLAVVVEHNGRTRFARVKLPDVLPRFVPIPSDVAEQPGESFAFLEDVVRLNVGSLFPGAAVRGAHLFRIVRDTDMVIQEDEADDLLESVDRTLKELRYGDLSQLLVESSMPARVLNILIENFEIEEHVVTRTSGRMGFGDWSALAKLHRPRLKDAPFSPHVLWANGDGDAIFDAIRERDHLVHHPFESFSAVEAFLRAAVDDPHVIAIKLTLYRIGPNSPLVDLLIQAADAGKQVAVLVELKARFDERNNIEWAHRLESAGVHVVYGLLHLKTHCKLCLVVRKEVDGIMRYAHVGTGNYNRVTSQIYTDFGLFTARPEVLDEVTEVFNYLTGYSNKRDYDELLVAPHHLRRAFSALVEREAEHAREGRPARIVIKNNSVADPEMIRVLYRASQAGVRIDMIVRGVCCLRPGIPGVSETIRVRSVVGRFLEHSRLYYFENGGQPEALIGSADLMERNLDRRVEALCRVRDPDLRSHLHDVVLETMLADTDRAMVLRTDGSYRPVRRKPGAKPVNAQEKLLRAHAARRRAG